MKPLERSPSDLQTQFLALDTAFDVAELLGVDYQLLKTILYVVPLERQYTTFTVPKQAGGERTIMTPSPLLKRWQGQLNQILQLVYQPKDPVHGFVPDRSILTNARVHAGQYYVMNVDLKDFFPSINFGRVRGMFMAPPYRLGDGAATVLAQICCIDNQLPQGAPTSPAVSNMVCGRLDGALQSLAEREGWLYTRYADDITFSTGQTSLSSAIVARFLQDGETEVEPGYGLRRIIERNGFEIHPEKVRLQVKYQHQEVTGLTTNEFPNVSRRFVRQIRAMLHAWRKFGLEAASLEHFRRYRQTPRNPRKPPASFKQVVRGKIEFLAMVRGRDDKIYRKYWNQYASLDPDAQPIKDEIGSELGSRDLFTDKTLLDWIESLPFPLASILWTYYATADEKDKSDHLLHFYEALGQFLATILLSAFQDDAETRTAVADTLEKTPHSLRRSTFGTWSLLYGFLAKHVRKMQHSAPTELQDAFGTIDQGILNLLSSKQMATLLQKTNQLRNSWSGHTGIVSTPEAERRHRILQDHLRDVYALFDHEWREYPLILPDVSTQSRGIYTYQVKSVMGNRTPFASMTIRVRHPLEDGQLHLYAEDGEHALPLLPLVRVMPSPQTEQDACYFYNRREPEEIRFVSYHFEREAEIKQEFQSTAQALSLFENAA